MIDDHQWEFLHSQILAACTSAAFSRAHVYADNIDWAARSEFRTALGGALTAFGLAFQEDSVSEAEHTGNITALAEDLSDRYGHVLRNGRFRIGIAQKALNLYLKYLWCNGRGQVPHHCPLDRFIISFLPTKRQVAWTRLDDIDTYTKIIDGLKKVAGGVSIAEWELRVWSDP